jgi:hypothetical protein
MGSLLFVVAFESAAPLRAPQVERESFEVWLCPVHRDEQSTRAGNCPVCERELVHRILVPSYACPMHQHIDEEEPGECPVCNMKLVSTTRELQFYCSERPDIVSSLPGECPDGSPMLMRSVPMAHGDHNPKHGGILFMAPNGFHHLEGTLDDDGVFRLYLYDDFTKPIDARDFRAKAGETALDAEPDGAFLSTQLEEAGKYPAEIVLYLSFPEEDEAARFDFIFASASGTDVATEPDLVLPEFRIPDTSDGIFEEILVRDARVRDLIERGVWPDLYIPALEAKDLVLALVEAEGDRVAVPAKRLVRAAWLLDNYGDEGNRLRVEEAYRLFERAIRELREAYE